MKNSRNVFVENTTKILPWKKITDYVIFFSIFWKKNRQIFYITKKYDMEYIEKILAFYVLYLYVFGIYTLPVRAYVHRAALAFPSLWAELRLFCVRSSVARIARSLAGCVCQLFDRGGG
jgi:hypothetical protein